jgi:hypothetical protein
VPCARRRRSRIFTGAASSRSLRAGDTLAMLRRDEILADLRALCDAARQILRERLRPVLSIAPRE